jgi:hypothetical protein
VVSPETVHNALQPTRVGRWTSISPFGVSPTSRRLNEIRLFRRLCAATTLDRCPPHPVGAPYPRVAKYTTGFSHSALIRRAGFPACLGAGSAWQAGKPVLQILALYRSLVVALRANGFIAQTHLDTHLCGAALGNLYSGAGRKVTQEQEARTELKVPTKMEITDGQQSGTANKDCRSQRISEA